MRTVLVIAMLLATAGVAHAQAPGETAPRKIHRYGWKVAAVDLAAVGLALVGTVDAVEHDGHSWGVVAIGAGVATYLFGGPVVHGRRGNAGAASWSVAVRMLVPVGAGGVGALVGWAHGKDREAGMGTLTGAAIGMGVGVPLAMAIDWFVLARERKVTPVVEPLRGGGAVAGLAGTF
jgi:hypothetical protein